MSDCGFDWDVSDIDNSQLYDLYGVSYKINLDVIIEDLIDVRKWMLKYLNESLGFKMLVDMGKTAINEEESQYMIVDSETGSLTTIKESDTQGTGGEEEEFIVHPNAPKYTISDEPTEGWLIDPNDKIFIPFKFATPLVIKTSRQQFLETLNVRFGNHRFFKKMALENEDYLTQSYFEIDPKMCSSGLVINSIGTNIFKGSSGLFTSYIDLGSVASTPYYMRGLSDIFNASDKYLYPFNTNMLPTNDVYSGNIDYIGLNSYKTPYKLNGNNEDHLKANSPISIGEVNRADYNGAVYHYNHKIEIDFKGSLYIVALSDDTSGRSDYSEIDTTVSIDGGASTLLSSFEFFRTQKPVTVESGEELSTLIVYKIPDAVDSTITIENENQTYFSLYGYIYDKNENDWYG